VKHWYHCDCWCFSDKTLGQDQWNTGTTIYDCWCFSDKTLGQDQWNTVVPLYMIAGVFQIWNIYFPVSVFFLNNIQDLICLWLYVFNAIFNNISAISPWSVLLMEETTDLPQVTDKLYDIMLYRGHLQLHVPVHSVPITTKVVSSNPAHGRCTQYNIMW
jgi:hypothetical protein